MTQWAGVGEAHQFEVRLVEVRGDFAYTVLGAPDGFEATCLTGRRSSEDVYSAGFAGPLVPDPSAVGLVTNGVRASANSNGDAECEVTGKAGRDVSAVTFDVDGGTVHATVKDGFFAAWWPGTAEQAERVGPPNPDVTLTLRDGTQVTRPIEDFNTRPM